METLVELDYLKPRGDKREVLEPIGSDKVKPQIPTLRDESAESVKKQQTGQKKASVKELFKLKRKPNPKPKPAKDKSTHELFDDLF